MESYLRVFAIRSSQFSSLCISTSADADSWTPPGYLILHPLRIASTTPSGNAQASATPQTRARLQYNIESPRSACYFLTQKIAICVSAAPYLEEQHAFQVIDPANPAFCPLQLNDCFVT